VIVGGLVLVQGRRERALKLVGALFLLLGFGAFHRLAPWTLLHEHVPVFRSQHVPSRFLYPAVLMLAVVAASGLGRLVERRRRVAPWLDLVLAVAAAWLAFDVASVAQQPMRQAMWMVPPEIPPGRSFHFEEQPPFHYRKRDWAGPMLLSMMANTGVLDCYGVPRSESWRWSAQTPSDPHYRGEVTLEGGGEARIVAWSPNRVEVALEPLATSTVLVYNMHHWPGWHAALDPDADAEVVSQGGRIAVGLPPGTRSLRLYYRPPGWRLGLAIFAVTSLMLLSWWRRCRDDDNDCVP
jgi:hypothetical protein